MKATGAFFVSERGRFPLVPGRQAATSYPSGPQQLAGAAGTATTPSRPGRTGGRFADLRRFEMSQERLRRLSNALKRASEDLVKARVLVDAALRQLEDQVEDCLAHVEKGEAARRT
jgi:hypothetical protein